MPDKKNQKVGVTEVVLRDGHQSLLATRFTLADMLPIAKKLDQVGYWSIESWGEQLLIRALDISMKILGRDLEH